MIVAVTSEGKDLESKVDLRFGRAKNFIIYDTEKDGFEVVDNELQMNIPQGAGIQTGKNIADQNAEAVITGNVGPNAFKTLNAADIKVFLAGDMTVKEALEKFKQGELEEEKHANVEGHWM